MKRKIFISVIIVGLIASLCWAVIGNYKLGISRNEYNTKVEEIEELEELNSQNKDKLDKYESKPQITGSIITVSELGGKVLTNEDTLTLGCRYVCSIKNSYSNTFDVDKVVDFKLECYGIGVVKEDAADFKNINFYDFKYDSSKYMVNVDNKIVIDANKTQEKDIIFIFLVTSPAVVEIHEYIDSNEILSFKIGSQML